MSLRINVFPDFVKNADILFTKGKESVPMVMRGSGMVREVAIPDGTGNTREFTEVDLEQYASRKGESQQSAVARVQQGYSKVGTLYRVAADITISYEMRHYGKYGEITDKLTNLGKLASQRMELDLAHRLSFGTATSYTDRDGESVDVSVGDGLALFATAHTVLGSASTFRNRLNGNAALSRSSLESMEQMRVENCINQLGEKVAIKDDILWVTDNPVDINTAKEILNSTSTDDANVNSGVVNTYQAAYKLVILPLVATDASGNVDSTKNAYWGVCASQYSSFFLGVNEEPHMKATNPGGNADEFSTDDWTFGTRAGYMIVIPSAGWIGFSSGDAA